MKPSHESLVERACSQLYTNGNLDAVEGFFADDYVVHHAGSTTTGGHKTIRRAISMYRRAFHDIQVEIVILVESTDRIAWQRSFRALHQGSFKGFPPTQSPIVWRDLVATRFRDGLIAEEWLVTDLAESLLREAKRTH